jgi:hypothetical protein
LVYPGRKILAKLQTPGALSYVAPYNVAAIYAGLGDASQAFTWLERGFEERSYYLATYFPDDEPLDDLRADPRFTDLKRRLNLPLASGGSSDSIDLLSVVDIPHEKL